MTRPERIRKLANAIRMYRGATSTPPGAIVKKWKRAPQKAVGGIVRDHLQQLGRDVEADMKAIDAFETHTQFEDWIKTL